MNRADVARALSAVKDPEIGLDIVSLGLIYGITVEEGALTLELALTSPDCPMGDLIASMAASRLASLVRGTDVRIHIVEDPAWNVAMVDAEGRGALGLPP
jgi:metal-sulfur cluster biosynthetic enzyme